MPSLDNYFKDLQEQILDEEKWDKDRFHVFDYEAGTGKSGSSQLFIGELTKTKPIKVLFVQMFEKEEALLNTVNIINEHAGRKVAMAFAGDETKKTAVRKEAIESQVLCITHNMYIEICKGRRQELIKGRELLIIDEFPNILRKVEVTERDIGYLWIIQYRHQSEVLEQLAILLRDKLKHLRAELKANNRNELIFVDFQEYEFNKILKTLPDQLEKVTNNKELTTILEKIQQILTNGCFYYENCLYTFDNNINFQMLSNNIILDANGFDYRYNLSDKFLVRHQEKHFSYSTSKLHHIEIKTTKKELSKQINLFENVLEQVLPNPRNKTLFIIDKNNKQKLEDKIKDFLFNRGMDEKQIDVVFQEQFKVDYFGNIIGVNKYRDFKDVIVLKTPSFDYLTYALTYLYYRVNDQKEVGNVEIFKHTEVEKIRQSVIAGEIYQGLKRINRNNSLSSTMYVCSTNQEAVDIVLRQLPGIQYEKVTNTSYSNKKTVKKQSKFDMQVKTLQDVLLKSKEEGKSEIKKSEIRNQLENMDKGNFTKVIKACNKFFQKEGFINQTRKIILSNQ